MKQWFVVHVKVESDPDNKADYVPTPEEVAAEVRVRLENRDLDTGWLVTKVSAA